MFINSWLDNKQLTTVLSSAPALTPRQALLSLFFQSALFDARNGLCQLKPNSPLNTHNSILM